MAPLDERIERIRREREAQEKREQEARRAARRSHPGAEDSDPPGWPPEPIDDTRPGAGNRHIEFEKVKSTRQWFESVWGVLSVLVAAAGVGWLAQAAFSGTAKKETTDAIQRDLAKLTADVEKNQAVVETNLSTLKTDVTEIKDALRINKNPDPPITAEKKPKEKKPQ